MSFNKMPPKSKIKSIKKDIEPDNNEGNLDLSIIRKPPDNISGFIHLQKLYVSGTAEVKGILSTECDYMYECKVCKSIFRSVIQLISHKRVYCKDKYNPSKHANFIKNMSLASELLKLRELELLITEMQTEVREVKKSDQIPMTKDLTEVIEKLNAQRGVSNEKIRNEIQQVTLQGIPESKNAVYQSTPEELYHMKVQVRELHQMLDMTEKVVVNEDGTYTSLETKKSQPPQPDTEGVIHISDDDDEQHLFCKICKLKFSTQKTLKFHMKTKHLSSRLVYPCPDCTDLFSNSWSVYRHLFKVHRKTSAQVRKLREWVQSKTFRMDKVPAFYEKKKNALKIATQKAAAVSNDNQDWVENMESDGESPRCGGCGRVFERRAALAAHAYTCQPRRALMRATSFGRPMQIIRKKPAGIVANTPAKEDSPDEDNVMEIDEEDSSSSGSQNDNTDDVNNDNDTSPDYPEIKPPKLTSYEKTEKRNLEALNKKILLDIDFETLLCKKCNKSSPKMDELLEHMAEHYSWNRYSCKLCFYKNYHIANISDHIRTVHKLNGDSMFYSRTINALEPAEAISDESESPQSSQEVKEDVKSATEIAPIEPSIKKRKLNEQTKKKKEKIDVKDDENSTDAISLRSEENSSDMDDIETSNVFVATKRPVRKRSKPKYDDFEYDLSNLLKMEAQGYKDSQINTKVTQYKKIQKIQSNPPSPTRENNKDYSGALLTLSKKACEKSKAHLRLLKIPDVCSPRNQRSISVFAKPFSKSKDNIKEIRSSLTMEDMERVSLLKEAYIIKDSKNKVKNPVENNKSVIESTSKYEKVSIPETNGVTKIQKSTSETVKPNIQIKVPRQSLEMMKNPMMNKSLSGLLSKVVVLKQRIRKDGERPAMKLKGDTLKVVKIAPKPIAPKIDSENKIVKDVKAENSVIAVTTNKPEESVAETVNNSLPLVTNNCETVNNT